MKVTPASLKRFLKEKHGFESTVDNLRIRISEGKPKAAWFYFRYRQGQQVHRPRLGVLSEDGSPEVNDRTAQQIVKTYQHYQYHYLQGVTPADLERIDRRAEIERGESMLSRLTVHDLFDMYINEHLMPRWKNPRQRQLVYENHIRPYIGKTIAEDVKKVELQALVNRLLTQGKNAQAHYVAVFLAEVWKWGGSKKEDYFPELRPSRASDLETLGVPPREREATDEELHRIVTQGRPAMRGFVFVGNRVIDALQMEFQNFDSDPNWKNWYEIPPNKYKTKKHHRMYITETVLESIRQHQEQARIKSDQWCFVGLKTKSGGHLSTSHFHKNWDDLNLAELAPLDQPTLQKRDIRRTMYTFCEKNWSIEVAGAVEGHAKVGMGKIYGRYDYKKEKMDAMLAWEEHLLSLLK